MKYQTVNSVLLIRSVLRLYSLTPALSLISTHAFRLSPAKFFAWDMRRVVKRIEQDKKYLSLCSHLKFKYLNFCEIFAQRNQSDFFLESRGHFTKIKKVSPNGRPTALSGPKKEDRPQYILKTRIIKLQTSFHSKRVEINFSTEIFFTNEK